MLDRMPFERRERSLFNYLDNFEKNFFGDQSFPQFRTDVLDRGDHYELQAELPGFQKEEISIDVKDGVLTVRAEHKEEAEETKENYVRRERRYGSFRRSFDLTGVDDTSIGADYSDGVLTLKLPKAAQEVPASRRIEIK